MGERKAYQDYDYRLDDSKLGQDEPAGNRLLDRDGQVAHTSGAAGGLSAIALALDHFGNQMSADHLEKVVWWVKDWQMHRQGWYRKVTGTYEYAQALQALKGSAEFRAHERRARWYMRFACLATVVATLMFAALLASWSHTPWGWRIVWGFIALLVAGLASGLTDTARNEWQVQDRKYFLGCLRRAECTEDLLDAGLFAYDPDTMQTKDMLRHRRAVRRLQRQLGQALYFDFDSCIRENFLVEHATPRGVPEVASTV